MTGRALALSLMVAGCSSPAVQVELRVPTGQHPLSLCDRVWLSLADATGRTLQVKTEVATAASLDLSGIAPGEGDVLTLEGTYGIDVIAAGRSCPFGIHAGAPPPSVPILFGLVGRFTPASPPATSRIGQVAFTVDGLPTFAGGTVDGGPPLASSESYDAEAGHFQTGPTLTVPRVEAQAVTLPDGRVLILGGAPVGASGMETLTLGQLQPVASGFPSDMVEEATAVFPSGQVLVAGGRSAGGAPAASALLLTADGSAITPAGSMVFARARHTATLLGGGSASSVLVAGGIGAGSAAVGPLEIYDLATGFSAAGATLKTARSDHTTTLLPSGLVLIAGGRDSAGVPTASAEIFDPVGRTVFGAPNLKTARAQHVAVVLAPGRVLFVGGVGADGNPTASAEIFDLALGDQGDFVPTSPLTTPRVQPMVTALCDGTLLLVGGGAGAELYIPSR